MTWSVEDLRVFRCVADSGSFGSAAARLYLSQPAVSERMAGSNATSAGSCSSAAGAAHG
jgi:Bacterial regulatory helix-turn-helix protein, lysR family